jgi:hypothetical protein
MLTIKKVYAQKRKTSSAFVAGKLESEMRENVEYLWGERD